MFCMIERFPILDETGNEVGCIEAVDSVPRIFITAHEFEWISGYLNHCIAKERVITDAHKTWQQIHRLFQNDASPVLFWKIEDLSRGHLRVVCKPDTQSVEE